MFAPQSAVIQEGPVSWHAWDILPARVMFKQGTTDFAAFPPIKWVGDWGKEQLGLFGSSQEGSSGLQSAN